ncbi:MAG: hypothetical protein BHW55_05495 [Candidatus Melainabacteria bacterium 35_41]|jgi:hypothetical protein|nr:MAG: hypothetical protein BHW55_05495 [Candidatus Melainabacteria bacterium 35_41]
MSLRIGAYKAGNNPITRFQKSDNIERLFKIADKNIGFDIQKRLNREQVVNLLNQFGQTGERALKELPSNAEKFEYFAAHGALEITSNDNNVILITKKIKNPVSEMIKSIPHRIKSFLK